VAKPPPDAAAAPFGRRSGVAVKLQAHIAGTGLEGVFGFGQGGAGRLQYWTEQARELARFLQAGQGETNVVSPAGVRSKIANLFDAYRGASAACNRGQTCGRSAAELGGHKALASQQT